MIKISITVAKKKVSNSDDLMRAQLALLSMFAMVDDVFTEDDALSKEKRRMSLGRIYEEWKRCRADLDPKFNPKKHDRIMQFGARPIKGGLSQTAQT